jgi:hypothetical protein
LYEKGRNQRNYHICLNEILKSVENAMTQGGFPQYVCMGDEIRYMQVIPVLITIHGDGKSGDTLVLCYGGKNCKGRTSRLCMMPFEHLSDPMHQCPLILSSHLHHLYCQSISKELTTSERGAYRVALSKCQLIAETTFFSE